MEVELTDVERGAQPGATDGRRRTVDERQAEDQAQAWERLEEVRMYGGDSHEIAVAEFDTGLEEALRERYRPERIAWATDGRSVTVTYVHDPENAPRPV